NYARGSDCVSSKRSDGTIEASVPPHHAVWKSVGRRGKNSLGTRSAIYICIRLPVPNLSMARAPWLWSSHLLDRSRRHCCSMDTPRVLLPAFDRGEEWVWSL